MSSGTAPFDGRRALAVVTAALVWLASQTVSQAALLNIAPPPSPIPRTDIYANFADVIYTASSDRFLALAGSVSIDYDNVGSPDYDLVDDGVSQIPDFRLDIRVNDSGTLTGGAPGGPDLVITGAIDFDGSGDMNGGESFDTLLTGDVLAFGYQGTSPFRVFDFIFSVTGGTQAASFGGLGAQVGVILDAVNYTTPFTGSFNSNFNGGGLGNADTFAPVPEPSTLLLLVTGVGMTLLVRRAGRRGGFLRV